MLPPSQRDGVIAAPLDDELVLYGPGGAQPYLLNATAAEIWSWCDGVRPIEAIAALLTDTHGLVPEQALRDVSSCVADLRQAGLLAP